MNLQPHEERVVQERNELNEKLEKLSHFMDKTAVYIDLPKRDKELLIAQENIMVQYQQILNERIGRFIK